MSIIFLHWPKNFTAHCNVMEKQLDCLYNYNIVTGKQNCIAFANVRERGDNSSNLISGKGLKLKELLTLASYFLLCACVLKTLKLRKQSSRCQRCKEIYILTLVYISKKTYKSRPITNSFTSCAKIIQSSLNSFKFPLSLDYLRNLAGSGLMYSVVILRDNLMINI